MILAEPRTGEHGPTCDPVAACGRTSSRETHRHSAEGGTRNDPSKSAKKRVWHLHEKGMSVCTRACRATLATRIAMRTDVLRSGLLACLGAHVTMGARLLSYAYHMPVHRSIMAARLPGWPSSSHLDRSFKFEAHTLVDDGHNPTATRITRRPWQSLWTASGSWGSGIRSQSTIT